jgi:hypothetical protein
MDSFPVALGTTIVAWALVLRLTQPQLPLRPPD